MITQDRSRASCSNSELVDQAIRLLDTVDRDLVATFLNRRGVHFSVIVRVLSEPHQRRWHSYINSDLVSSGYTG
jgi:hypothetical protein